MTVATTASRIGVAVRTVSNSDFFLGVSAAGAGCESMTVSTITNGLRGFYCRTRRKANVAVSLAFCALWVLGRRHFATPFRQRLPQEILDLSVQAAQLLLGPTLHG